MMSTTIILAALSILSGSSSQIDLDKVLGENKAEIFQQVEGLKGSRLTQIRGTVDILAHYRLAIESKPLILANNAQSEGVSYSTDPDYQKIV